MSYVEGNAERLILPAEFAQVVTPERIARNEQVLFAQLPEVNPDALQRARERLLATPLRLYVENYEDLSQLEISLGLTACKFLGWEEDGSDPYIERQFVKPDILFTDRAVVVPIDFLEVPQAWEDERGNRVELGREEKAKRVSIYEQFFESNAYGYHELQSFVNNPQYFAPSDKRIFDSPQERGILALFLKQLDAMYFDQVVSGRVWFEHASAMIAAGNMQAEPSAIVQYTGDEIPREFAIESALDISPKPQEIPEPAEDIALAPDAGSEGTFEAEVLQLFPGHGHNGRRR